MHARDADVASRKHVVSLIESSILVDVNLDTAENTKWWRSSICFGGKLTVDALDFFQLPDEALSRESVRDGEVGRVIGHDAVLVPQRTRRMRHLHDRTSAVGPERVRVTVTLQRASQRVTSGSKRLRRRFQLLEIIGDLARQRFQYYGFCRFTD